MTSSVAGGPRSIRDDDVVVTGIGVISSIGTGVAEFAAGLRAGRSGVSPITAFDTSGFDHANGCEVTDFDPGPWVRTLDPASLGRAAQFSVSAARMAVEDAGIEAAELAAKRMLVSIGTTDGESSDLDRVVAADLAGGADEVDPVVAGRTSASRLSVAVARELGLVDVETMTIATACAAGNYTIGYGYDAVRSGEVDMVLCGGADALCRKTFASFYRLGTIAPDVCRPFDADRQGILTGEGAGVLVLERWGDARKRGARVYARILGYGLNCDATHQVAPDQDSVARCMALALENAGVKPDEVDLISAHGTGTRANDLTESSAIREVYGGKPPRTISIKSMLGHAMGAASALGAIACALAIHRGFIPPTINHRRTDPELGIDCVPNTALDVAPAIVQNNGLAFGGNNAVVILGRHEEENP